MVAAEYGHLDIIKELVKAGVDINVKNKDNKTALDLAKEKVRTEIVQYLESLNK